MKLQSLNSDTAVLTELGARIGRARVHGNRTQQQLATAAGVGKRTVERIEAGGSIQLLNFIRVLRALDSVGQLDAVLPDSPPSPIEQLKGNRPPRQRASSRVQVAEPSRSWKWGDEK